MNRAVVCFVLGVCAGILIGYCADARAQGVTPPNTDITFKLCGGSKTLTFKQPPGTDKLEVYCPGNPKPVFTIQGCVGPHVKRVGSDYTVKCDRFVHYTPGVPIDP